MRFTETLKAIMRNDKKPNAEKDDPGPQVSLASKTFETNVSLRKEVMMLGIMLYADLCDTDYLQTFVSNCSSTFFESRCFLSIP